MLFVLYSRTKKGEAFSSTKILMDTCYCSLIQGWVILLVEGKAFDVFVKEVSRELFGILKARD